jgi:hypothetical protein
MARFPIGLGLDQPQANFIPEFSYGQTGTTTGLLSSVTAPVRARALPFSVAPVVIVIDA